MHITKEDIVVGVKIKRFPVEMRGKFLVFLKGRNHNCVESYKYSKDLFSKIDAGEELTFLTDIERFEDGSVKESEWNRQFKDIIDFMSLYTKEVQENVFGCEYLSERVCRNWGGHSVPASVMQSPEMKLQEDAYAWADSLSDKEKEYMKIIILNSLPMG